VDYSIQINKTTKICDSDHLIDIYNHKLVIYLKHGVTLIASVMVEDPVNNLTDSIEKLKNRIDINMAHISYYIK